MRTKKVDVKNYKKPKKKRRNMPAGKKHRKKGRN